MRTMDEPTQGPPSSPEAVFLSGLKRLARPDTGGSSPFHRTRSPFIRLRDVLAGVRSDRSPVHPSSCQDPTCGQPLTERAALEVLRRMLLPLATLVTPNLLEAAALTGRSVRNVADMHDAARALVDLGARAALVTGGHLAGPPVDVLFDGAVFQELDGPRIGGTPAHGTGCTLSAAITAGLAADLSLADAIARARRYVQRALESAPALGRGHRPLNHLVSPDGR